MIIEIVEKMEDGTQWTYTFESHENALYRSEDGQQYTKAEIDLFKQEMQNKGVLIAYTER